MRWRRDKVVERGRVWTDYVSGPYRLERGHTEPRGEQRGWFTVIYLDGKQRIEPVQKQPTLVRAKAYAAWHAANLAKAVAA